MSSFESHTQTESIDSPENTDEGKFPNPEDVDHLSAKIDYFLEEVPEISGGDLDRLNQIKDRLGLIRKQAGRVLRAGLLSSSILIGGMQNATAAESHYEEASPQTKVEQVEKTDLERRINDFKDLIGGDTNERLAVFYNGVEVLNKQSESDELVALTMKELQSFPDGHDVTSRTFLHTHPLEGASAPTQMDINSLFTSHIGLREAENKSIVVDSDGGVWHLKVDVNHPTTKQFDLLPKLYEELRENIPEQIIEVLSSDNSEELMQREDIEKIFTDFRKSTDMRVAETLGEEVQGMLDSIEGARIEINSAESDNSREIAIAKYLEILSNLGVIASYEESDRSEQKYLISKN